MSRVVALIVCVAFAGCSFAFVEAPPDHPRAGEPFDCTETSWLPAVDGVPAFFFDLFAVAALGLVAGTFATGGPHGEGEGLGVALGLITGVPAAVVGATYTGSAIYGARTVERCRAAKRATTRPPREDL